MKLGIFCNFGPPHTGGSEEVIKQIAHNLPESYNTTIYSYSQKNIYDDRGILTVPCLKGDKLISQINENDHIFVYSDSFWGWDTIVENIDKVVPDVSVALVGAYHMREHNKATAEKFMANIGRFRAIVHARGADYKWCVQKHIPYKIIPNGVDLSEFRNNKIDFREKYGIGKKRILLNVSNYFYGKGQEYLGMIDKELKEMLDDYIFVSVSNTISYPYDKIFLAKAKYSFDDDSRCLFLRDLPREDVVAAFKCSDVFVFPSRKEIAPLVILESRAAGLPWVSFEVGNVSDNGGGLVVAKRHTFNKGYIIADDIDFAKFAEYIAWVFNGNHGYRYGKRETPRERCLRESQYGLDILDWKNIILEYKKVFGL